MKPSLPQIVPYAVWMAIMALLPAGALSYAIRSLVTAVVLFYVVFKYFKFTLPTLKDCLWGVGAGVLVLALWVLPEQSSFYMKWFVIGSQTNNAPSFYDPSVCGWPLTLARLVGSAFIIAVAEELFFRKWLLGFAGFWWMVALFAIEHDRYLAGALAGIVYGLLSIKVSLKSAIIAHVTTNFALGVIVVKYGLWRFW
ncbi:MAG: hypothetical protein J6S51_01620 [Kiritimatiellae bacterium]|nr:hypothetical protein [Kiritimatiellia bacterium]